MNSFFAILVAAYLLQPARVVADDCGSYTVMLNSFGMSDGYTMSLDLASKENVIKAVREVTVLGLREAKELVEAAPTSVAEGLSSEEAESMTATLEAAGAEVEIECDE